MRSSIISCSGQGSRGSTSLNSVSPQFIIARAVMPIFSTNCGSTRMMMGWLDMFPLSGRWRPTYPMIMGLCRTDHTMLHDYIKKILNAPVYDVAIQSPLDFAPQISQRIGTKVWLKREDLQPVFSFKLRG